MILAVLILLTAPYERVAVKNGMTISRRTLDNGLLELRVEGHSTLPGKALFDVLWNHPDVPKWNKYAKRTEILRDIGRERIVYEQVKVPIVQDRDYTTRGRFDIQPTGLIQLIWEGANELGPPEKKDHVRIKLTQGSWTLEPTPDGGCDYTYIVASEAGGGVPNWLIAGAQTDGAPDFVTTVIARARALQTR